MTDVVPGSPALSIEFDAHDDSMTVVVRGELDALTAASLPSTVCGAGLHVGQSVEVDIAGVTFIDSAGLRGLVLCNQAITALGARMRVVAPSRQALRLFEITATLEYLDVGAPSRR